MIKVEFGPFQVQQERSTHPLGALAYKAYAMSVRIHPRAATSK